MFFARSRAMPGSPDIGSLDQFARGNRAVVQKLLASRRGIKGGNGLQLFDGEGLGIDRSRFLFEIAAARRQLQRLLVDRGGDDRPEVRRTPGSAGPSAVRPGSAGSRRNRPVAFMRGERSTRGLQVLIGATSSAWATAPKQHAGYENGRQRAKRPKPVKLIMSIQCSCL